MRRIETAEDQMTGAVTYDLGDKRFIKFSARDVRKYGVEEMLRHMGYGDKMPTGRVNVMQRGRLVGTVPAMFDPARIKSASFLYDPRPGDFVMVGDHWEASKMLGPGDLESVSGFIPATPST